MDDLDPKRANLHGARRRRADPEGARLRKAVRHKTDLAEEAKGHRRWADRLHSMRESLDRLGEVKLGRHPIDRLQVLVIPLLIFGILRAFFEAPDLRQALQRARTASVAETADLAGAEPEADAVLGGRLGVARDAFFPVDSAAAAYRLVLYKRQRWECEEDEDGGYTGAWRLSAYVAPEAITLNGREIAIRLDRPTTMSGDLVSLPVEERDWGLRCDGRIEGSIRYTGYHDGDSVCVFGRTRSDAVLVVERLHGGGCESFIAYLEGRARGARKVGSILLGIALLIEIVWLGIRVLPRLPRRRS